MPVRPAEIALAKVAANALIVLLAVLLSIELVIRRGLGVPIAGSVPLFLAGTFVYLFATASARHPDRHRRQFHAAARADGDPDLHHHAAPFRRHDAAGEHPEVLQWAMHASPSVYFVQFAQAILYRGAGIEAVWQPLVIMAAIGALFLQL